MTEKTPKIGKKGGAKRITDKLKQIRRTPLSKEIFQIVDESSSQTTEPKLKKIATPKVDLET
jgi:hypothetical protein